VVRLTVRDSTGRTASATKTVTVRETPPPTTSTTSGPSLLPR
jgi:hypothetical protein